MYILPTPLFSTCKLFVHSSFPIAIQNNAHATIRLFQKIYPCPLKQKLNRFINIFLNIFFFEEHTIQPIQPYGELLVGIPDIGLTWVLVDRGAI